MIDTQPETALILYTGEGCHLCDLARDIVNEVLSSAGGQLAFELVSITGDKGLTALYGERIPVVKNLLGEEKGWPFTVGQIKKML